MPSQICEKGAHGLEMIRYDLGDRQAHDRSEHGKTGIETEFSGNDRQQKSRRADRDGASHEVSNPRHRKPDTEKMEDSILRDGGLMGRKRAPQVLGPPCKR